MVRASCTEIRVIPGAASISTDCFGCLLTKQLNISPSLLERGTQLLFLCGHLQGVPFKRMVLQFKTFNQDVSQVVEKMAQCVDLDTQSPYRFGESGDVIAQVLRL